MELSFNNQTYALQNFSFTINTIISQDEENIVTQQKVLSCILIANDINLTNLEASLNNIPINLNIQIQQENNYTFNNYILENINVLTRNDGIVEISISFCKDII